MARTTAEAFEDIAGESPPAMRVLIVAAYASVRAGLHAMLAEAPDVAVIDEVSGSAELERVLPDEHPDVLLYDRSAADAMRVAEIAREAVLPLVVLGEDGAGSRMLSDLAAAGLPGWAWLRKDADASDLSAAVRAAAAGLIVLDPSLAPALVAAKSDGPIPVSETPGEALTARERDVLQLMAQGLPNKVIASRLRISQHTAKFHVASILAKLNAASRTEAVAQGVRQGYIAL